MKIRVFSDASKAQQRLLTNRQVAPNETPGARGDGAAAVTTKRKLYKTNAAEAKKKQESENNIKQKRQAWTSATRASRRFVIVLAAPDLDERTGQTARIPAPGARRANPWRHRRRVFRESRRRRDSRGRARRPPKLHRPQRPRRRTTRCIR